MFSRHDVFHDQHAWRHAMRASMKQNLLSFKVLHLNPVTCWPVQRVVCCCRHGGVGQEIQVAAINAGDTQHDSNCVVSTSAVRRRRRSKSSSSSSSSGSGMPVSLPIQQQKHQQRKHAKPKPNVATNGNATLCSSSPSLDGSRSSLLRTAAAATSTSPSKSSNNRNSSIGTGNYHGPGIDTGLGNVDAADIRDSAGAFTAGGPLADVDAVQGLVSGATVRFNDSAALRLRRRAMIVWEQGAPQRVLIVKKPVPAAAQLLADMAQWLQQHGLQVYVESSVWEEEFPDYLPFDAAATRVDFAITLGGDGTVLHLASLFKEDVPLPPVMCFAMGTLGFLTPFDANHFRNCLTRVLGANQEPVYCTLRTRKRCALLDNGGKQLRVHHILNECTIDRGAFPSSVQLEIYIDGSFVTSAEADGLIIATPSGSTAYSMSAGGSMVAPSVPCTLITPLSPHSLSFRPLIIPETAHLFVRLAPDARSHARASFDGKFPMRIQRGSALHFQSSLCPLPLINVGTLDSDWYKGITQKLKWNQLIRGPDKLHPSMGNGSSVNRLCPSAMACINDGSVML